MTVTGTGNNDDYRGDGDGGYKHSGSSDVGAAMLVVPVVVGEGTAAVSSSSAAAALLVANDEEKANRRRRRQHRHVSWSADEMFEEELPSPPAVVRTPARRRLS